MGIGLGWLNEWPSGSTHYKAAVCLRSCGLHCGDPFHLTDGSGKWTCSQQRIFFFLPEGFAVGAGSTSGVHLHSVGQVISQILPGDTASWDFPSTLLALELLRGIYK